MLFVCHPKILHKHCLQFLLRVIPSLARSREACFTRPNRRACLQAIARPKYACIAGGTELQVQRSDHSATLPPHAVTKSCSEVTTDRALNRN